MPTMTTEYWRRAIAAVDRRRAELARKELPEEDDPVWREIEHLNWLEIFAKTSLEEMEAFDIF